MVRATGHRLARWRLLVGACLALGLGLLGAPAAAQAQASLPGAGVSVVGGTLVQAGRPWVPDGVQIVGDVAPDGALSGKYSDAHAHFSTAELAQAAADHANVIRFQVSQFGLDPLNPLYSPAYVSEVQQAVQSARQLGMAAIVSVQAEAPAGQNSRCPLPDAGTERVWNELAGMFASDDDVLFELYNEPAVGNSAVGWYEWLDGGLITQGNGSSCTAVGMQTLINDIRNDGAENVIIVPGLRSEQTLAGMPFPTDPADPLDPQLAYGIHYPSMTGGPTTWDKAFGYLSGRVPMIVTEWDSNSTHDCVASAPTEAPLLLHYLASKQIGLIGFGFDLPGTIIADWSYAPTTYSGFVCGVPGGGPGELLFGNYAALEQSQSPYGADAPPAWVVTAAALKALTHSHLSLIQHFFDNPRAFVSGAGTGGVTHDGAPVAIPTEIFTNEAKLASAVNRHELRYGTEAVIYEDQDSKRTPRAQQLHPGTYYQRAAQVAHSHGLMLIAAPSTSLVSAIAPHTRPGKVVAKFLKLRIPFEAAHYADVYVAQAQQIESSRSKYDSFLRSATTQAATAHPGIELLGGLTTALSSRTAISQVLVRAVLSAQPLVSGFWLDNPQPTKPPRRSNPAVGFLRALRAVQ